jgi:Fe2+ or Zn2+ uptake regulation protein
MKWLNKKKLHNSSSGSIYAALKLAAELGVIHTFDTCNLSPLHKISQ